MVLNVRLKQRDAVLRMLNFNEASTALSKKASEDGSSPYKILVLDSFSKLIVAPLVSVQDLRQKGGVTLHLSIDAAREPIPDVPAVYFVSGTQENIQRLLQDAEEGLYDTLYLNFISHISPQGMESLAQGAVKKMCAQRISKVFDQYLAFIALESNMFSLGLPNSYLELNDPAAKDTQIEASTSAVVEGLFSALGTLGVVPIIRCPKGGAAQHVAMQLDQRIREHLKQRNNLFNEAASGLVSSLNRPLLCLFDRNFELSVVLQHTWTYKPLVHDVLGMDLNRITVDESAGKSMLPGAQQSSKKSFEVGDGDFFWEANGRAQFPSVAAEVDAQISQYKQAIEEINMQTGANMDPNADPNDLMQQTTKGLMAAVSRLPQLTDRKRTLDKHTNLLHHLLREIQSRTLDQYYNAEEALLVGKGDFAAVEKLLQTGKGKPEDNLRLALVYLLTAERLPSEAEFSRIEAALGSASEGLQALRYVRRMRRMNLTGKSAASAMSAAPIDGGSLPGLSNVSQSNLLSWAGTFGQGFNTLTKGVKNLLAGEQQAAVTVAVEGLMDAKPVPELESFAVFDPKAPPGRASAGGGSFKEAIVFVVGGGNYLEAESLATWASRAQPPKNVIYGATALLTGEQFAAQLAQLGQLSGAA